MARKKTVLGGLLLMTLLFFFVDEMGASSNTPTTADGKRYMILIDAGSSGSRMHVHGYKDATQGGIPEIDHSINYKQKPGLSSYAENPADVHKALGELREFAEKNVEEFLRATTPIHVQSTAGLRLLPIEQAETILEAVRDEVQTWGFAFERNNARIISGTEEGLNGWLAVNYLEKVFDKSTVDEKDTFGVVEMGGASLQLTYSPLLSALSPEQAKGLEVVTIGGNSFQVYTHSYLGYGLEQAQLGLSKNGIGQIEDKGNPCYPPGSKHSGIGSYKSCVKLIKKTLFKDGKLKSACSDSNLCSFEGKFQPPLANEKFLAIENFYYTTDFFGIAESKKVLTDIRKKGSTFCKADFTKSIEKYKKEDAGNLQKYCFAGAYIDAMLTFALGFADEQVLEEVHIEREIDGVGIDWALGAVVSLLTNAINVNTDGSAATPATKSLSLQRVEDSSGSFFTSFYGILALLLVAGAVIFFVRRKMQQRKMAASDPFNLGV